MAFYLGRSWEELEKLGLASSYDARTWFEKLLRKPVRKIYALHHIFS
jgi:hypothetical protein